MMMGDATPASWPPVLIKPVEYPITPEGKRSMGKDQKGPWIAGRKKPVAVKNTTAMVAFVAVAVSARKTALPRRVETSTVFRLPLRSEM
jgi:hypothetical protein